MRLQGVTKELQGVTRGYRGLQGVRGNYITIQEVTVGNLGLHGVKRVYRGLQGVTGVKRE